ncbi:speckle-type POZ protein B-like [Diachasmimorpha longicaudata]|uniref:speckle-type POZ protein B-like n=1 Tax=Diachasmimorpha longicaudata TaxID=58733 RepID=UPI0030B88638
MLSLRQLALCSLVVVLMIHSATSTLPTITTKESGVTEFATEHLSYEWIIKNYTLIPWDDGCIRSPEFHGAEKDIRWMIELCDLHQLSDGKYNPAIYLSTFSMHRRNQQRNISGKISIFESGILIASTIFGQRMVGAGRDRFKYSDQAMTDRLKSLESPQSFITIHYEIDMPFIFRKIINNTEPVKSEFSHDSKKGRLTDDFGLLLKGGQLSDITIIAGNQTLSAHKIILATRSPIFGAMIEQAERNKSEKIQINIENMEPAVVEMMLEFIYTDDVFDLRELPVIYGLLSAADRFQIPRLKTLCRNVLRERLDENAAADILVSSMV